MSFFNMVHDTEKKSKEKTLFEEVGISYPPDLDKTILLQNIGTAEKKIERKREYLEIEYKNPKYVEKLNDVSVYTSGYESDSLVCKDRGTSDKIFQCIKQKEIAIENKRGELLSQTKKMKTNLEEEWRCLEDELRQKGIKAHEISDLD